MNIVRENRDDLTGVLTVTVTDADYGQSVTKILKDYRQKANIPGFRKGMVPMGIVEKMYRKGVVAEESYKTASQACFDYIEKEKIKYVGDLLPSEEQPKLDFDTDTEHTYVFEYGQAPEVNLELSNKDKVERYGIKVDNVMYDGYRTNFLRRYGQLVDVDEVANDEALTVTLDNDEMNVEDAYVGLISMTEEERKPFIGKKAGDVMEVNINELYTNPSQRAAILQVKEDELEGIKPEFKLTINKIRKFAEPELNEEFFKTAFPAGEVTDEEGFRSFITAQINKDLSRETDYLFSYQVRRMLLDKAGLPMPENFLKRWLHVVNEGKFSQEEIEKDFDKFVDMMRWNILQQYFAEKFELKVEPEEALEEAKTMTLMQFAQYGMNQLDDEMLTGYAQRILSEREEARKIYDRLYEKKVIEAVTPLIGIKDKEVTSEEFGKIAGQAAN